MSSGLSESSGSLPVNGCSAPERTSVVLPEPLGPATIQNQGGFRKPPESHWTGRFAHCRPNERRRLRRARSVSNTAGRRRASPEPHARRRRRRRAPPCCRLTHGAESVASPDLARRHRFYDACVWPLPSREEPPGLLGATPAGPARHRMMPPRPAAWKVAFLRCVSTSQAPIRSRSAAFSLAAMWARDCVPPRDADRPGSDRARFVR